MNLATIRSVKVNDYVYENQYFNGSSWIAYPSTPAEVVSARYIKSYRSPGFRSLTRSALPVQPLQLGGLIVSYSGCDVGKAGSGLRWKGAVNYWFPTFNPQQGPLDGYNTLPIKDNAEMNVRNALNSGSINVAQAFAERKQTASLIQDSVVRFVRFARYVRRGKLSKAYSEVERSRSIVTGKFNLAGFRRPSDLEYVPNFKTFQSLWLEYHFGWMPLLSDIYGACELLANTYHEGNPPQYARAVGTAKTTDDFTRTRTSYGVTVRDDIRRKIEARSVILYRTGPLASSLLSQTGISNPQTLAWELLPFSFVVDWFVPVGNYLNAMSIPQDLVFHRGATTVKSVGKSKTTFVGSSLGYQGLEMCSTKQEHFIIDRYAMQTWPVLKSPTPLGGFDTWKAYTSVALLSQLFIK